MFIGEGTGMQSTTLMKLDNMLNPYVMCISAHNRRSKPVLVKFQVSTDDTINSMIASTWASSNDK